MIDYSMGSIFHEKNGYLYYLEYDQNTEIADIMKADINGDQSPSVIGNCAQYDLLYVYSSGIVIANDPLNGYFSRPTELNLQWSIVDKFN